MKPSQEIQLAAEWLLEQADAEKSASGVEVLPGEIDFARQRLRASAAGLLAGFHLPEPAEVAHD